MIRDWLKLLQSYCDDPHGPVVPDNARHGDFIYEENQIALMRSRDLEGLRLQLRED